MQAVLDTQFWLATHVTCVTLGYATTFVAGLLGLIYVVRGVFTPSTVARRRQRPGPHDLRHASASPSSSASSARCWAGLWADDSWGRFWGWDPKENGALIIVLWNALVLHARWGGMVKDRGLAVAGRRRQHRHQLVLVRRQRTGRRACTPTASPKACWWRWACSAPARF